MSSEPSCDGLHVADGAIVRGHRRRQVRTEGVVRLGLSRRHVAALRRVVQHAKRVSGMLFTEQAVQDHQNPAVLVRLPE